MWTLDQGFALGLVKLDIAKMRRIRRQNTLARRRAISVPRQWRVRMRKVQACVNTLNIPINVENMERYVS